MPTGSDPKQFFNAETADFILSEHGPAKLVTAAGVFFHLEELHSVVEGIHRLIGGRMACSWCRPSISAA